MTIHHSNFGLRMHDYGLCRNWPAEWFDIDATYEDQRRATRVCLACPIRRECLAAHLKKPTAIGCVRAGWQFPMRSEKPRKVPGIDVPD